ncbi:hypothetical protein MPSEU_000928400 [Mayamaea pseudoterrestris]|nr:hypothetical protein MPSEU_000928400 [Mayamaea pseudoterrestris]
MAALADRPATVPSITLSITKQDGEKFQLASEAVSKCLEQLERSKGCASSTTNAAATTTNESADQSTNDGIMIGRSKGLLELLEEAVKLCQNPFLSAFLRHLAASRLSPDERRLSLLLFANMTKSAKLKLLFDTLESKDSTGLGREQLVSLFRIILTSISCCVPPNHCGSTSKPLENGSPESHTQERKRFKADHCQSDEIHAERSREDEEADVVGASSFESAASLKDEDDAAALVQKEIQEVAAYAADSLKNYTSGHFGEGKNVTFAIFGEWYSTEEAGENASWVELLHKSKWLTPQPIRNADLPISRDESKATNSSQPSHQAEVAAPSALEHESPTDSPTLISFDFSGSGAPHPLVIRISEENIQALRHMVYRTGMIFCQAADMCKMLLQLASRTSPSARPDNLNVNRAVFHSAIGRFVIPAHVMHLCSPAEQEAFVTALMDIFTCLQGSRQGLAPDEADLQEVATAICFFCAGNKSTKLSTAFELLDDQRLGYLTQAQLLRYLQSHLLALTTLAYLQPVSPHMQRRATTLERARILRESVMSGAKWTLSHFLEYLGTPNPTGTQDQFSFESFASWYCSGGYNVAPWLELLDLNKVLSLLNDQRPVSPLSMGTHSFPHSDRGLVTTARRPVLRDRMSSLRRHHALRKISSALPPDVLFSFPMAGGRSLIVLRDDAIYVREIVDTLCLLAANPHVTWSALYNCVAKRRTHHMEETATYVNQATFVECMKEAIPANDRKRRLEDDDSAPSVTELLSNFYQCFDIDQGDNVALDELMGGMSLLCGGKKSLKLAFAFGIFDTRPGMNRKKPGEGVIHSLSGEDLFLFLRSVLIVLFSCCRQSLDWSDEIVGRCICDTANLICNDVMRHQWETKHLDRLNFDDFGQWYNDGGFERAPWLELLDLKKWVLIDNLEAQPKQEPVLSNPLGSSLELPRRPVRSESRSPKPAPRPEAREKTRHIVSLPSEDDLDDSFFDDNQIIGMGSMDEMDMFLSADTDQTDRVLKMAGSFSLSPKNVRRPEPEMSRPAPEPPLKFHLVTADSHGGYNMIFSQRQINHLRRVLQESGLLDVTIEQVCRVVLARASGARDADPRISQQHYDSAMISMLKWKSNASTETKRSMIGMLEEVFACFIGDGNLDPSAAEVACGITVFCQGKKSDKLEHAFELLDQKRRGKLSKKELVRYFQSFLTVLLGISVCSCLDSDLTTDSLQTLRGAKVEQSPSAVARAAKTGAEWTANLIFQELQKATSALLSFDDFASWYTTKGHVSMPWLELIDLRKWVLQV